MSVLTYPYTPGLTFGETTRFDVEVHRFDDLSEQRYLRSVQRGLELTYEYPTPSSALVAGIESWFVGHVGPGLFFNVTDHRTGQTHLARFADNVLEHVRRAPMQRSLTVRFHVVESGHTAVVLQPFTRAAPPDCTIISSCFPVSTPAITGVDPDVFLPPAGTIVGSGNSIEAPAGADFFFWRTTSHAILGGWYVGNQLPRQDTTLAEETPTRNRVYAQPFISARSGATIAELAIFVNAAGTAGGEMRLGLYEARSSATVNAYPGALLVDAGMVPTDAVGLQTATASYQLQNQLYFLACVRSSNTIAVRHVFDQSNRVLLGLDESFNRVTHWVMSHAPGAFPDPFPDPGERITNDLQEPPGILVRYQR